MFDHTVGHVVPGAFFLLHGLWWLFNIVASDASSYESRTWHRGAGIKHCCLPVEPCIKVVFSLVGMAAELASCRLSVFTHGTGAADGAVFRMDSVSNISHCSMYAFFAFSGFVELLVFHKCLRSVHGVQHLTLALAFFVEGILFYFHLALGHRSPIDVTAHVIIYWLCFASSGVVLLEHAYSSRRELGMMRCYLILIQASWFFQLAYCVYGPHKWSSTATSDAAMLPVAFAWHCLAWAFIIAAVLVLYDRTRSTKRSRVPRKKSASAGYSAHQLLPPHPSVDIECDEVQCALSHDDWFYDDS